MTVTATHHDHRVRTLVAVVVLLLLLATPAWLWWRASRTSASFADSEVLESNHLGAGTVDISVGTEAARFEARNLAPGDVATGQLELDNAGTLPVRYWITATTDGAPLGDWLRFGLWQASGICSPDAPGSALAADVALSSEPTLLAGSVLVADTASGAADLTLPPGEKVTLCLVATLPLQAPNSVQGQELALDITVQAEHDPRQEP